MKQPSLRITEQKTADQVAHLNDSTTMCTRCDKVIPLREEFGGECRPCRALSVAEALERNYRGNGRPPALGPETEWLQRTASQFTPFSSRRTKPRLHPEY